MIKTYCDSCGKELNAQNTFETPGLTAQIKLAETKMYIDVSLSILKTPTHVDICKECVIKSVKKMDNGEIYEYQANLDEPRAK